MKHFGGDDILSLWLVHFVSFKQSDDKLNIKREIQKDMVGLKSIINITMA